MTSPMARMSAVVSVMITSITTTMEIVAPTAKIGVPKWNGAVSWKICALEMSLKLVSPNGMATMVPSTRPEQDRHPAEERPAGSGRSAR